MTGTLLAEEWKRCLRDVDDAEQVRLDLLTKALLRHLLDASALGIAGIVDNVMGPPVMVEGPRRSPNRPTDITGTCDWDM